MDTRPEQPPEGRLIADAADRLDLSIREAARRAGISYGRWRQIVMGYQNVSPGSYAAVHAPAKTVAKMARVVGVTPAQLTEAGREDAAAILAELTVPEPATPESSPETGAEPAGSAEDIGDAVVTILRARQGEPGVWADLRDYLAGAGLFNDAAEAGAWPPGDIPAELTPKAEQALDAAAVAGTLFRDEIGTIAARIGSHARDGSYPWHLRVRMITQLRETARETARNPTRARRAG